MDSHSFPASSWVVVKALLVALIAFLACPPAVRAETYPYVNWHSGAIVSGDHLLDETLTCGTQSIGPGESPEAAGLPAWWYQVVQGSDLPLIHGWFYGPFTYQWDREGIPIAGATSATYLQTDADVTHEVFCTMSGGIEYGSTSTRSSRKEYGGLPIGRTLVMTSGKLGLWVKGKRLTKCGQKRARPCALPAGMSDLRLSVSRTNPLWERRVVTFRGEPRSLSFGFAGRRVTKDGYAHQPLSRLNFPCDASGVFMLRTSTKWVLGNSWAREPGGAAAASPRLWLTIPPATKTAPGEPRNCGHSDGIR